MTSQTQIIPSQPKYLFKAEVRNAHLRLVGADGPHDLLNGANRELSTGDDTGALSAKDSDAITQLSRSESRSRNETFIIALVKSL